MTKKNIFYWRVVLVQVQWLELLSRYGLENLQQCEKGFNPNQPWRMKWGPVVLFVLLPFKLSKFYEIWRFFVKFICNCYSGFFLKIQTGFCSVSTFHDQVLFFVYVFCWNIQFIFGNICWICVQRILTKLLLTFLIIHLQYAWSLGNLIYS